MLSLAPLILLLLGATAQAAVLTITSPRFTITSSNGSQLRSESISLDKKPSPPLSLGATDVLKLTFQVVVKEEEEKGVRPHQTFLRFYDEETGEEGIQPVRVTNGGKAKFELNMAKPPSSLPPTTTSSSPLSITLLLGSFTHSPAKISLFELFLPPSLPPPADPEFTILPEIKHTFRSEETLPMRTVSAVFAGVVVVVPWVVLLAVWGTIQPRTPHLFSPSILPFTLLLGAFEALLVWYWVDLKLGQVLLYGGVLGVFTGLAGKGALRAIGEKRVGRVG